MYRIEPTEDDEDLIDIPLKFVLGMNKVFEEYLLYFVFYFVA